VDGTANFVAGLPWCAYSLALVDGETGAALDTLRDKVDGQQYMVLSPYPDLDQPIAADVIAKVEAIEGILAVRVL